MEARKEEVLRILKGWEEKGTPLFFSASMYGLAVEGRTYIFAFNDEGVTLRSNGSDFFAGFPLTDDRLRFWYAEAREVGSSELLSESEKSATGIGITFGMRQPLSSTEASVPEKLILIELPE